MSAFTLTLTAGGGAELVERDEVIWVSVDDESFRDEFPDEFLGEEDVDEILEYLVSEDYLTEDEANECEVEMESVDVDTVAEDDQVEHHWPDQPGD